MRYLIFVLIGLTLGCNVSAGLKCLPSEQQSVSEHLYFGREKPDGAVSESDWLKFLDEVVTPEFPDGLTVIEAYGRWSPDGVQIISEDTYILNIIHSDSMANRTSIEKIKGEYISRFQQKSVLRIRNEVCATF